MARSRRMTVGALTMAVSLGGLVGCPGNQRQVRPDEERSGQTEQPAEPRTDGGETEAPGTEHACGEGQCAEGQCAGAPQPE